MSSERLKDVLGHAAGLLRGVLAAGAALVALGLGVLRARTRKLLMAPQTLVHATGDVMAWARPRGSASSTTRANEAQDARRSKNGNSALRPTPAQAVTSSAERDPTSTKKLDLGPAARAEKPVEHIPWSYGIDRITAAAVDPERLYVYWEVTDQAIERARAGLGPGGPEARLNLRIYDTTGLLFDGTNAHNYFDHAIDRSDRQWFFTVGKPSSTAFVEIGTKSLEESFATIARSSRVDFPRADPAPWSEPEWMTVLPNTGEARRDGTGVPSRGKPPAPLGHYGPPPPFTPSPLWVLREAAIDHEGRIREFLEDGRECVEWREVEHEGWWELERRTDWQEPRVVTTWEAGPFTYPVEIAPPLREEWQGRSFAYRVGDVTHVVYGPWEVVIRNLGGRESRAVLGRWEIYRSWVAENSGEARETGDGHARMVRTGASELVAPGASERHWRSASELRLGGASELWRIGASEARLRGASELLFAGASQFLLAGASERRFLGASEMRLRGASEQRLGGASERFGASERHLGGSEQRFEGGSANPLPHPPEESAYPKAE